MVRGLMIVDVAGETYTLICANRVVKKVSLNHLVNNILLRPHKAEYCFKTVFYEQIPMDELGCHVAEKCDIIIEGGIWNADDFLNAWNSPYCDAGLEVY